MVKKDSNSVAIVLLVLAVIALVFFVQSGGLFAIIPGYSNASSQSSVITNDVVFTSNGNSTIYFTTDQTGIHSVNFSVRQTQAGSANALFDVYFNGMKIAANQEASSTSPTKVSYSVNVLQAGQQVLVVSFINDFYAAGVNTLVTGANLLPNPTFTTNLNGWYFNSTQHIWTNLISHDAGGSVQFNTYSWPNDYTNLFASPFTGVVSQSVPVTQGEIISLSGWLKSTGSTTETVESGINFFDSTGAYVSGAGASGLVTSSNWEYFKVNRTAPVTGTVHVFVTTYPKGTFVAYADEFVLTKTTGTVMATQDRNLYVSQLTLTSPTTSLPLQCELACQAGYTLSVNSCACIANCPTISTVQPSCINNGSLIVGVKDSNNCLIAPYCTGISVNQTTNATTNSGTNNTGNTNTNSGSTGTTSQTSSFDAFNWINTNPILAAGIVIVSIVLFILITKK